MQESILQSVGRTPLVRLRRMAEGTPCAVYVKVEAMNPGGSVKDRVGMAMIAEAERRGLLRPGGTIIEATAGNTGVGLAMVAAVKGYRCIFVLPDKMASEKIALLKAYGAEVVVTATNVPPDSPDSYNGVADRLAREIPGAWRPNQFTNLANPEIHYRTTGPEIWEQTEGRVTAFVTGAGTGGTLSGVGRYLKERNPEVRIVGADPEGSVLSGDSPRPWKVEGIGEDFVPKTFNSQVVDEWIRVGDAESFAAARALSRREGILAGGSSGTSVAAALRYARRLTRDAVVVAMVCDTGRNYLSKFFDDAWLAANNLVLQEQRAHSVGDLLKTRGPRQLVSIGPGATVAEAIDLMESAGISQLPVLDGGKAVGSIQEVTLARVLHDNADPTQVRVGDVMARPLPQLDTAVHLDEAYRLLLSGNTGVLAVADGKVADIITRIDLVQYWDQKRKK
jgi:cystathionine beta-synthase